jgi:HAD superfamily hydrolase (TIGR01484 family)
MIFAIDLDGTLLDSNKKVREASKRAIADAQKKGHLVIPITGRSFMGVQDIISELKITKYAVINNGSSIYNIKKNAFHNYPPVQKDAIKDLMDVARKEQAQFSVHAIKRTIRCSFSKSKSTLKSKND